MALDKGVAQSGAQSLRLRRLPALAKPAEPRVPASAVLAKCGDVVSIWNKTGIGLYRQAHLQAMLSGPSRVRDSCSSMWS